MRRRFMTSAPNKVVIDDIIKCSYRVTMDQYEEYGGALILGTEFDLSQVEWIAVYENGELYMEFEPSSVIGISAGDWDDIRIKVNNLTNCNHMFYETGLNSADFSSVNKEVISSCSFMFCNTLITKSPFDVLPIKFLSPNCCYGMFDGCTSLVNAPELPATTLASFCYCDMFNGCTSLVNAPELPAITLADSCYDGMFYDCKNLNYIKMLATDISAVRCLYRWVHNVSTTGTFVKNKDATWDVVGDSGVPTGWTVITDDQLVNGKVVNPISVRYGNLNSYIKQYPVYVDSVYPVSSDLYVGFDINTVDGELAFITRPILIGETSQSPAYTKTTPITNIVYGPKEDACFIYDFPEANEDVTLSIFDILLGETLYKGYYERGMTWREYCGSRYNISGFRISGDYVYNNASLVEDDNGNSVSPDDLIVENGVYYTVE